MALPVAISAEVRRIHDTDVGLFVQCYDNRFSRSCVDLIMKKLRSGLLSSVILLRSLQVSLARARQTI